MTRPAMRRIVLTVGTATLLAVGCTGGGQDDGGTVAPEAGDVTGADADDATDPDDTTDADDATEAEADDGEPDDGAAPPVSVVTVEPIDAPRSTTEIRVGEIIVELDGEVTDEGTVLTLEEPILFDFDSSTLKPASNEALNEIAEVLAFYEGAPVEVVGHTDDVGGADYNRRLSSERAQAVLDGLARRGIPADRMTGEGRGFDDPAVPNDSDANRAINRRVEILIVGVVPPDQDG